MLHVITCASNLISAPGGRCCGCSEAGGRKTTTTTTITTVTVEEPPRMPVWQSWDFLLTSAPSAHHHPATLDRGAAVRNRVVSRGQSMRSSKQLLRADRGGG